MGRAAGKCDFKHVANNKSSDQHAHLHADHSLSCSLHLYCSEFIDDMTGRTAWISKLIHDIFFANIVMAFLRVSSHMTFSMASSYSDCRTI